MTMTEKEIIQRLKRNKEECTIFMKLLKEVQEYISVKEKDGALIFLNYEGDCWLEHGYRQISNSRVYALPDDYPEPEDSPEVLEFDVNEDGAYEINSFSDCDICAPRMIIYKNNIKYKFVGYKFEGFPSTHNEYILFDIEGTRKTVYANKVVYSKVEG